jgi:hypothetical protein
LWGERLFIIRDSRKGLLRPAGAGLAMKVQRIRFGTRLITNAECGYGHCEERSDEAIHITATAKKVSVMPPPLYSRKTPALP